MSLSASNFVQKVVYAAIFRTRFILAYYMDCGDVLVLRNAECIGKNVNT